MKNMTILAASALMITPICMVAQAGPTAVQEYADESIAIVNDMARIIDRVASSAHYGGIPSMVDASVADLNALKPRLAALRAAEAEFSYEEKLLLTSDVAYKRKLEVALGRVSKAVGMLRLTMDIASPADKARLMKLVEVMLSLNM